MDYREVSETRDGMQIDWDMPIKMEDGTILRADIYRPIEEGTYPVILTHGPYGKWLHFEDTYADQWRIMCESHPEVPEGTSNKYQNWETVDPEKWVPGGYVVVRIDSRGAGRSDGVMDIWSRQEALDQYECIEWAAEQSWSTGKIGLNGISYYAMNQWQTAEFQPPHLTAMCAWEGSTDYYRDMVFHGGIYCPSRVNWFRSQILPVQNGKGSNGFKSRMTGDWVAGPETLSEKELEDRRHDFDTESASHPLATEEFWTSRLPDFSKINVPLLSAGNWGGQGLHPRGNFEGFTRSASKEKWLEMHGKEHWTEFYTDYGIALQKKFFGHFLKGEDTGWSEQPRVLLQVRHPGEKFVERGEDAWPLSSTQWTKFYLDPDGHALSKKPQSEEGAVTYGGLSEGVTYFTPPLEEDTEITGPIAAKLFVSSKTEDADLFVIFRVFSPDMKEVTFIGAIDPHTPVAQGWLRASHRKLDENLSTPYAPYHTHDEVQELTPGDVYELDIEVVPTCIVAPKGYRIAVSIKGCDYEWPGGSTTGLGTHGANFTGVGNFKHSDPDDRPDAIFGGNVTLHSGPDHLAHILLPIIPAK
jgi:predicted acyl esterase